MDVQFFFLKLDLPFFCHSFFRKRVWNGYHPVGKQTGSQECSIFWFITFLSAFLWREGQKSTYFPTWPNLKRDITSGVSSQEVEIEPQRTGEMRQVDEPQSGFGGSPNLNEAIDVGAED